jgi:hypothetical protein
MGIPETRYGIYDKSIDPGICAGIGKILYQMGMDGFGEDHAGIPDAGRNGKIVQSFQVQADRYIVLVGFVKIIP